MAQSYATTANVKTRAGIPDTDDDTLIGNIVGQVNAWIEHYIGRPVGPDDGATYTFDGAEDVSPDGRSLFVRNGIRTITTITVAPSTGSDAVTGTVADFVVLPRTQNRRPGWPGFEIRIKDAVTGSVSIFGFGYSDIVVTGDFGWSAIPTELTEVAETIAVRAWHARQTGQADIVGTDETGQPVVSRYVSPRDKATLRAFRPAGGLVAA